MPTRSGTITGEKRVMPDMVIIIKCITVIITATSITTATRQYGITNQCAITIILPDIAGKLFMYNRIGRDIITGLLITGLRFAK